MAEEMNLQLSVSEVVHYRSSDIRCIAAIVTSVCSIHDNEAILTIFPPHGQPHTLGKFTEKGDTEGTWHWPEHLMK